MMSNHYFSIFGDNTKTVTPQDLHDQTQTITQNVNHLSAQTSTVLALAILFLVLAVAGLGVVWYKKQTKSKAIKQDCNRLEMEIKNLETQIKSTLTTDAKNLLEKELEHKLKELTLTKKFYLMLTGKEL